MSYVVTNDNEIHYIGPDREKAMNVFDAMQGEARLERLETVESLSNVLNGHTDVKVQCCSGECASEARSEKTSSLADTIDDVLFRGLDLLEEAYSVVKKFTVKDFVGEIQEKSPEITNKIRGGFAKTGNWIVAVGEQIKTDLEECTSNEDEEALLEKTGDWIINLGKKLQSTVGNDI